jgi:hypothetical protein
MAMRIPAPTPQSGYVASKDVGLKLDAYAEMGVAEYVTFDLRPW